MRVDLDHVQVSGSTIKAKVKYIPRVSCSQCIWHKLKQFYAENKAVDGFFRKGLWKGWSLRLSKTMAQGHAK